MNGDETLSLPLICAMSPGAAFLLLHDRWPLSVDPKSKTSNWSPSSLTRWSMLVAIILVIASILFAGMRISRLETSSAAISTVTLDGTRQPLEMNELERCVHAIIFGWSLFCGPFLLLGSVRLRSVWHFALNTGTIAGFVFSVWLFLGPLLVCQP